MCRSVSACIRLSRAFVWLTETSSCCYSADPEEDILEMFVDLAVEFNP